MTDLQATGTGLPYQVPPKLDVMEATRTTWRVFKRQPWPFIGFLFAPLLVVFPAQILQGIIQFAMTLSLGKDSGLTIFVTLIVTLVVLVLQYCAQFTCQMAALWGAERNLEGARFGFGDALRAGYARLLPYFGLFFLNLLIILVGYLVLAIPSMIVAYALGYGVIFGAVGGLVLLVIPIIIVSGYLALGPSACVLERRGPIESIKRSFALVAQNWWRCFGTVMLVVGLPMLAFVATVLVLFLVFKSIGLPWLTLIMILPAIPFFIVLGALAVIVPAVLFVELRALKEGRGAGSFARVFD